MQDEAEAEISARKEFPEGFTVKNNLEIRSNSINNINLDSIVTKDTDQVLNITLLKGNVIVDNAVVEGKFNGENVTQIDQDLVKLNGEQYVSSTLIFAEELTVENFEMTETLNDVKLEEYLSKDDEEIDPDMKFEDVEVEDLTVEGGFTGSIPQIDIKDFNEKYLSYSKDQVIDVHFDIVQSTVENLEVDSLNNEKYDEFFSKEKFLEKIVEMVNTGRVNIQGN